MPVPPKQAISHYRGDSLGVRITCWLDDKKTQPANFAGTTITSQLREKIDDDEPADEFTVNSSGNIITLTLSPAKITALPDSTVWDVQVDWQSNGVSVQTILQGSLALTPDVTRA